MPRRSMPVSARRSAHTWVGQTPPKPRFTIPKFRLLRLTMVMAVLLCSVKLVNVYQGGKEIQLRLQDAYAQNKQAPAAAEGAQQEQEANTTEEGNEVSDSNAAEQQMAKLEGETDEMLASRRREFSQIELDLLQSLRKRRDELEERSRQLDLKEKLLEATELRINDKITEIKALEKKVSALLEKYGEQEESHVRSLVKIYENMKPKSAAAIFNELELVILLEVIDQMSERKVAPILAAMNPVKAKEVTADLARMRKLRAMQSQ